MQIADQIKTFDNSKTAILPQKFLSGWLRINKTFQVTNNQVKSDTFSFTLDTCKHIIKFSNMGICSLIWFNQF